MDWCRIKGHQEIITLRVSVAPFKYSFLWKQGEGNESERVETL